MSAWPLDCSFLGYNTADVWVGDVSGNWSNCTVKVIVEDKLNPTIICPDDITISCDLNEHKLSTTGELKVNYVCDIDVNTFYEDEVLSETCATTVIKRLWKYYDKNGNIFIACKQTITKGHSMTESHINWPEDVGLYDCDLKPDNIDPVNLSGEPKFIVSSCGDVHVQYTDDISKTCDEQYTIIRTWNLLDWCDGNTFSHVQEIVLTCSRAPIAYCIGPLIASVTKDGVLVYATDFDGGSFDLCGLDINVTASIDGSPYEDKFIFNCNDLGTHKVILKVENEAGEVEYCTTELTIIDDQKLCDRGERLTSPTEPTAYRKATLAPDMDTANSTVSVYPNPTAGVLHIELGVVVGLGHANIYNSYGTLLKSVSNIKSNALLSIDTQNLGAVGNMLFVEIYDGNIATVQKVILLK